MKKVRDCFEYNHSVFRQGPTRKPARLDERVSLEGMRREGLWGRFGLGLSRCDHGLFYTTRFELVLDLENHYNSTLFTINLSVTVVGEVRVLATQRYCSLRSKRASEPDTCDRVVPSPRHDVSSDLASGHMAWTFAPERHDHPSSR